MNASHPTLPPQGLCALIEAAADVSPRVVSHHKSLTGAGSFRGREMAKKRPKAIDCYTHTSSSTVGQTVNPEPGYYYVSFRSDSRTVLALGPFAQHQQALDYFDAVKALVEQRDPWSHFYQFGTHGITDHRYGNTAHTVPGRLQCGTLNQHFPDAPVLVVAPKGENRHV